MATVARQPFAPIDASRLQTITSLKNRQNATSLTPSVKRKAAEPVEDYDSENVDPLQSAKRSKGDDSKFGNDFFKPSKFVFTKAVSTPTLPTFDAALPSPMRVSARPRHILIAKSPAASKLNSSVSQAPSFAAPNRSPTRSTKRLGLLSNRRRTMGSIRSIDPPSSMRSSPAPFSLDAAIKGTVPGYMSRQAKHTSRSSLSNLLEPEIKSSWVFEIHEDTPEQEMTNLLQHSTCVLDISSDEESEQKLRAGRVEDKENIPPADDVSQTSVRRAAPRVADGGMDYEKPRNALGSLNVEDFYAPGCDGSTVVIVPADEESGVVVAGEEEQPSIAQEAVALDVASPVESVEAPASAVAVAEESVQATVEIHQDVASTVDIVDAIIKGEQPGHEASVLQPIDGTGDNFEMWESGSANDENEIPRARSVTPTPVLAELCPLDVPTM